MLLVAVVVGGIIAGAVYFKSRASEPEAKGPALTGDAKSGPAESAASNPIARSLELTGFRLSESAKQQVQVKMMIVNHSNADLTDLNLAVTLTTPEGKELGTANVKVPQVDPLGSVEVSTSLKTSLRAYELPDWQFIRAQFDLKQ